MIDTRLNKILEDIYVGHIASRIVASSAEKEVERLLKPLLRGTPFQNKAFAVGGYVIIF